MKSKQLDHDVMFKYQLRGEGNISSAVGCCGANKKVLSFVRYETPLMLPYTLTGDLVSKETVCCVTDEGLTLKTSVFESYGGLFNLLTLWLIIYFSTLYIGLSDCHFKWLYYLFS